MGGGSPRGVRLYIVTGVPPGESARARAEGRVRGERRARGGRQAQMMRLAADPVQILASASRRLAEAYAAELAARGLVVTWRRWRPRGTPA